MPIARVVQDLEELERLRPAWTALLLRSGGGEVTQSPAWQLAWWRTFGPIGGRALSVVAVEGGGRLLGLAPLLARRHVHRGVLPFRRLELLASGEPEADETCSDYLGVLAERGAERDVAEALAGALHEGPATAWDELILPAMDGASPMPTLLAAALRRRGDHVEIETTGHCPYLALPATWDAYLAALSSSSRYLLRRSLRDFEAWAAGEARFFLATTPAELDEGMRVLHTLHAERWRGRGQEGVFASARFAAFHRAVMPELLGEGRLELEWMTVRGEPLAVLYNLVHAGKVSFYQSGRRLDVPSRVRPGIVMHAHAIRRAIDAGRREYDFLAGASAYKARLSLAVRPLVCLRAARPSALEVARGALEHAVRGGRWLRGRVARRAPSEDRAAPALEGEAPGDR